MPMLNRLAETGFNIWPFSPARLPLIVEIYPRILTGDVVKSDPKARRDFLQSAVRIAPAFSAVASASEDAFDAAVSAKAMATHANEIINLPSATSEQERIEGRIWGPQVL